MKIIFNGKRVALRNYLNTKFITAKILSVLKFTISVVSNNTKFGKVEGYGRYEKGSQVLLKAIETTAGKFIQWSDGYLEKNRYVTVTSDATYVAIFEPVRITISYYTNY